MKAKLILALTAIFLFTGCYGNFTLVRKLYTWNGELGDKVVNTAVMWGMHFLQIYLVAGFLDVIFFNVVDFWTGSDPLSMNAGDKEEQIIQTKDGLFRLTVTQNRIDIVEIERHCETPKGSLTFNPDDKSFWKIFKNYLSEFHNCFFSISR